MSLIINQYTVQRYNKKRNNQQNIVDFDNILTWSIKNLSVLRG